MDNSALPSGVTTIVNASVSVMAPSVTDSVTSYVPGAASCSPFNPTNSSSGPVIAWVVDSPSKFHSNVAVDGSNVDTSGSRLMTSPAQYVERLGDGTISTCAAMACQRANNHAIDRVFVTIWRMLHKI